MPFVIRANFTASSSRIDRSGEPLAGRANQLVVPLEGTFLCSEGLGLRVRHGDLTMLVVHAAAEVKSSGIALTLRLPMTLFPGT